MASKKMKGLLHAPEDEKKMHAGNYRINQYKNLPKNEKQRLVEYRKVDFKKWKNKNALQ